MSDTKARRKAIADLIRSEAIGSQEEVTARLGVQGFQVTQATVSRDLDQLGAVKVKRGGALSYALPDQLGDRDWAAGQLRWIIGDWVQSTETAWNILVLRTPPGSAHLVGAAIDRARLPEIAGTVSGDDTLFLVIRDGFAAGEVKSRIDALSGVR